MPNVSYGVCNLLAWPELIGQNNGLLIFSIIFGPIFLHVPFIYLAFGTCKKHLIAKNVIHG
jgi:hypothetical protein